MRVHAWKKTERRLADNRRERIHLRVEKMARGANYVIVRMSRWAQRSLEDHDLAEQPLPRFVVDVQEDWRALAYVAGASRSDAP